MAKEQVSKRTQNALKAIEDAVFALLGEKEFEAVTAQEIYRKAGVNKMTFYKYHNNKYDALAKAFTSRINREYNTAVAKYLSIHETYDLDEANYQALLFVADFFERYRVQFSHLASPSGDLPKDVVFSALFSNYRRFFSDMIGKEICEENEYLVHFVFGAYRSLYECQMQKLAKDPSDPAPRQDIKKACRVIAKAFSLLQTALPNAEETPTANSAS
ncbi:MAG: TetR/AcrR family transcriptional regulator [Bacilli bacterium]|nr:TetR/AcrR family transcriptional regulator [Bacilli bacterium]